MTIQTVIRRAKAAIEKRGKVPDEGHAQGLDRAHRLASQPTESRRGHRRPGTNLTEYLPR